MFCDVRKKIHPLPYPKLVRPVLRDKCPIQFDSAHINLLYLGTVYGDIRKPEVLFKLFQKMVEKEPRLRLYVVGKKFGADADRYLTEYSEKLGDKLRCYAPIPPEQTADLLLRADVLVNMGNTVNNQMPSKVVEYISTGKPILNLSVNEKCSTLGLMKRSLGSRCSRGMRMISPPSTRRLISAARPEARNSLGRRRGKLSLKWNFPS